MNRTTREAARFPLSALVVSLAAFATIAAPVAARATSGVSVPEIEPNDVCPGQMIVCGEVVDPAALTPVGDVDCFHFEATAGEVITVGTDFAGDILDTQITLYQGVTCAPDDQIAFNNENPETFSRIDIVAPVTGTYTACVDVFSPGQTGSYLLFTACGPPAPGDFCESAFPLPCGTINLAGSTLGMSGSYNLPPGNDCTGFDAPGLDAVYVITEAEFVLDVVYTSTADASIYLVTDCTDPAGSCVAGADDVAGIGAETLFFDNAGVPGPYYLILDSFGFIAGEGGDYTLTGSLACPPVAVEPTTWGSIKSRYRTD